MIVTGDFNAVAGANKAYDLLVQPDGFADTWTDAAKRLGEGISTFNGFRPIQRQGERIDRILTRGAVKADEVEIVVFERAGQYPSDHFPVVAWLRWTAP